MTKGRDERGLTLSLRTLLRFHLELHAAFAAGARIGEVLSFKEALLSPLVMEQAAYLNTVAEGVLRKFADDEEKLLDHLDAMAESDLEALDSLLQKTAASCGTCGRAFCPDCKVCHSCEGGEHEGGDETSSKKAVLN